METLVLGRPSADRTSFIDALTADGVTVHTCHDDAWGCAALSDACPLDSGPIDAAVAFAAPGESLDPQGVACAHRARLPIVAVGGLSGDAMRLMADAELPDGREGTETVVGVMRVAATAARRHREAIQTAAADFLRDDEHLTVDVRRTRGGLRIAIGGQFAEERVGPIADQVRAAARSFDPQAPVVDVVVDREQHTAPID